VRTPCSEWEDFCDDVGVLRLRRIIRFADDVAPLRMTRYLEMTG